MTSVHKWMQYHIFKDNHDIQRSLDFSLLFFLLWFHQEGGVTGKIYTTHWIISWQRGGKTWQIREMKNDSVRRGSHPGIDGGQPSTGTTTDVTLLWPRSEPASTLSLLGHLVQIWDNICKTSRETEHSQLINTSSTVLP